MNIKTFLVIPLSLAFLVPVLGPVAAKTKIIGTYESWTASMFSDGKGKVCYLHSNPVKSAGKYKKRGDTYIQVTHRTKEKIRDEVSVTAGYTYRKDSSVTAEIDGQKRTLFTAGGTAWSDDAKADRALVKAMRAGRELVIKGTSGRGTLTVDRYSLKGFTAAHNAINKACKGR